MFNKKLNVYKTLLLILLSVLIFALAFVFPALSVANSIVYMDTDALVESVSLPDVKLRLRIRMYDSYREHDIDISDLDSISDIVYKSTTIPGITKDSVQKIYQESTFKQFLKQKLKTLQDIIVDNDGSERVIQVLAPFEMVELVRENSDVIEKYTGHKLTDRDYESVERFFNDNDKIVTSLNSVTIRKNTSYLGSNFRTTVILAAIIAAAGILIFFIIEILITGNLFASLVSLGTSLFFSGLLSLAAGVAARGLNAFSSVEPSGLLAFVSETVDGPLLVSGTVLALSSLICYILALVYSSLISRAAEREAEEEDEEEFSIEYYTQVPSEDQGEETKQLMPSADEEKNKETISTEAADIEDAWTRFWLSDGENAEDTKEDDDNDK